MERSSLDFIPHHINICVKYMGVCGELLSDYCIGTDPGSHWSDWANWKTGLIVEHGQVTNMAALEGHSG